MSSIRRHVLLLGPARSAISGVSTHLNQLFASQLSQQYQLSQFQVGSEGRKESKFAILLRVLFSPPQFAWCIIRTRPDIVHINTSFEPKGYWRDLAYLIVAKAFRRKVVYQIHGGALPQEFFAGKRRLTALLRRVLSWPDAVVLLSKRDLNAYREFVPQVRLEHIANAVEVKAANLSLERYNSSRPLRVAYVGRLADTKGVFEIIAAAAQLRDRGVPMHFKLAGYGPAESQLLGNIEQSGLTHSIELVGPVFGEQKQRFWQQAEVLAFPSYAEGLPYALLESMAAGAVPVITPVGAIPDVIQDSVHGLFIPVKNSVALGDALEKLHFDRSALWRMAQAGYERVEKDYSLTRLAAHFHRLYASVSKLN